MEHPPNKENHSHQNSNESDHKKNPAHPHHAKHSVQDIIMTRRSVRKYKNWDVPFDLVVQILDSVKYAPFAGNIINCKTIVVKSAAKREAIAEACSQQLWMAEAPIHIVVVAEPEKIERFYGNRGVRLYSVQGIAAAIQNMLLTARELKLGSCWVGAFDEEEIRLTLNIPEHLEIHAVITVGYPAERTQMPPKYRLEHYMFFEKWWGRIEGPKNALGHWSWPIQKAVHSVKKMLTHRRPQYTEEEKDGHDEHVEHH